MKYVKIKEIAEVVSGSTPKTNIDEYWNGGYNWITPKEITEDSKYIYNTERTLSIDGIKSCALKELKVNTVLLTSRAPIGKVALVGKTMYCNQGFKNIVCNEQVINPEYMYYWLKSHKQYLNSLGRGATFKEISKKIVEELEIPLQDLDTQHKIVEILDKSQELIDKRKEQIELLDELIQSRFIEMFGNPVTNPKGWEKSILKDITLKIGSGSTPKGGNSSYKTEGIALIRSMNVYNNKFIEKDLAFIDNEQAEKLKNVIIERNDILLNITGASVARCCIVPDKYIPARVNQHVCILRCDSKKISSIFLTHQLISESYQGLLWSIATNNGATREAITKQQIETLEVMCPPMELQEDFAVFVEKVNDIKAVLSKSLEQLNDNFDSLIQKAFKGELF